MGMKKRTANYLSKALFLFLLIITVLTLASCRSAGSDTIYENSILENNAQNETDYSLDFVWEYLDKWEFPRFSASRFEEVEKIFEKHYYKELPTPFDAASETARIFLAEYYATTDLTDEELVTDALITSYVDAVGDRYSIFRTPVEYDDYSENMSGKYIGIGVTVVENEEHFIEVISADEGSSAAAAGILPGDIIVAIDGKSVLEIGYSAAIDLIPGESGTYVLLSVMRGEEELSFNVVRKKVVEKSVIYSLEDGIGYIRIKSFKSNTDEQFKDAIDYMEKNGACGVIYDLRSNGGGYLESVENMLAYIAPKGTTLVTFSNDYDDPYVAKDSHTYFVPSVVICNNNTASAAELFTAGIRDLSEMGYFDATIVGTTTRGKGIMQNTYHLSGGSTLTLTVAYYNPPSGENYHDVGIKPDRTVAIENDADTQLAAAYEEIVKLIK